jgi:hypothetical protein
MRCTSWGTTTAPVDGGGRVAHDEVEVELLAE